MRRDLDTALVSRIAKHFHSIRVYSEYNVGLHLLTLWQHCKQLLILGLMHFCAELSETPALAPNT